MAENATPREHETSLPKWVVVCLCLLVFFGQIATLPGALDPFRSIKNAVMLAGLAVIAGAVVGRGLWRARLSVPWHPLALVIVIYPLMLSASAFWSLSPGRTAACATAAVVWMGGIWLFASMSQRDRDRLLLWCSAGLIVSASVMAFQAMGLRPLPLLGPEKGRLTLTGLTGNPADLAIAAVMLLPLLLFQHAEGKRVHRRVLALICATTAALTQTLTALAAMGVLGLAWLVLNRRNRRLLLWGAATLTMIGAIGVSSSRFRMAVEDYSSQNWYMMLSARSDGWVAAAEMIISRPWGGVGGGSFTHAYYSSRLSWLQRHQLLGRPRGAATHFETAHCDPLQVAAELGVLGIGWLVALAWVLIRYHRKDPLLLTSAAVVLPLSLLHYPAHIVVGLLPLSLMVAQLLAASPQHPITSRTPRLARVLAPVAFGLGLFCAYGQLRRIESLLWNGYAEHTITVAYAQGTAHALRSLTALERQAATRAQRYPFDAAWLWRLIGRSQLVRAHPVEAEQAFRTSYALWPHEEAEMGLGIALGQQGRRVEALQPLGRVCRVNPSLIRNIDDPRLRTLVREVLKLKAARAEER